MRGWLVPHAGGERCCWPASPWSPWWKSPGPTARKHPHGHAPHQCLGASGWRMGCGRSSREHSAEALAGWWVLLARRRSGCLPPAKGELLSDWVREWSRGAKEDKWLLAGVRSGVRGTLAGPEMLTLEVKQHHIVYPCYYYQCPLTSWFRANCVPRLPSVPHCGVCL